MLSAIYSPSKREEGFTLIELLVVIIIIGILAAIAIPLFLDQRKLAVDASVKSDVRNTLANIKTWQANDANANKAVANTGEFTNATNGGKVAQSPGNSIGISISSTGDATVCGYNNGGKTYLSDSASYLFSPATGQFTTGSCASGSTTGGTASTGSSSSGGSGSGGSTTVPTNPGTAIFTANFETSGSTSDNSWGSTTDTTCDSPALGGSWVSGISSNYKHAGLRSFKYYSGDPQTGRSICGVSNSAVAMTADNYYLITAWVYVPSGYPQFVSTVSVGTASQQSTPVAVTPDTWQKLTFTVKSTGAEQVKIRSTYGQTRSNIADNSYPGLNTYVDDVTVQPLS